MSLIDYQEENKVVIIQITFSTKEISSLDFTYQKESNG